MWVNRIDLQKLGQIAIILDQLGKIPVLGIRHLVPGNKAQDLQVLNLLAADHRVHVGQARAHRVETVAEGRQAEGRQAAVPQVAEGNHV